MSPEDIFEESGNFYELNIFEMLDDISSKKEALAFFNDENWVFNN